MYKSSFFVLGVISLFFIDSNENNTNIRKKENKIEYNNLLLYSLFSVPFIASKVKSLATLYLVNKNYSNEELNNLLSNVISKRDLKKAIRKINVMADIDEEGIEIMSKYLSKSLTFKDILFYNKILKNVNPKNYNNNCSKLDLDLTLNQIKNVFKNTINKY